MSKMEDVRKAMVEAMKAKDKDRKDTRMAALSAWSAARRPLWS